MYTVYSRFTTTVYHVLLDELLKETGHGSRIIVSKYLELVYTTQVNSAFRAL